MARKLLCLCAAWGALTGLSAAEPAAEWLPSGAAAVVQVTQPAALLGLIADFGIPLDGPEVQGLLRLIPGGDPRAAIEKLAGGGITLAIYPNDRSVFVIDAADDALFGVLRGVVEGIAKAQAGKPGVYFKEFPGASVLSLDGKQFFAFAGRRVILTTRPDLLKTIFERRGQPGESLASSQLYRQAVAAAGPGAAALAFADMAMLNQLPETAKSLASSSALDILFTGAIKQALRASNRVALGLRLDGKKVTLHASTDGKSDLAFSLPPSGAATLPNLGVPRQLAGMTLWRDLRQFYGSRETLFPERTSAGVLLENFLEIFFTGRDLTEEVFARLKPEVRLVVAGQQWDPKIGTPVEQYPAAAIVFRADQAEDFGEVLEEAWQKAIGITNFTRGQNAQPGLIIDRVSHAGVPYTVSYYSSRAEKDRARLPSRYNVRPSLARVGPYLILSTTDGLARDLIDAVNREDGRMGAASSPTHTLLEFPTGEGIAAALAANRPELVRQSVMKGAKQQKAEQEFDRNLAMLRKVESARLSFAQTASGHEADLELRLK